MREFIEIETIFILIFSFKIQVHIEAFIFMHDSVNTTFNFLHKWYTLYTCPVHVRAISAIPFKEKEERKSFPKTVLQINFSKLDFGSKCFLSFSILPLSGLHFLI